MCRYYQIVLVKFFLCLFRFTFGIEALDYQDLLLTFEENSKNKAFNFQGDNL